MFDSLTSWSVTGLLLTLRIGPLLVLAPPFSQIGIPARVRLCLVLALSACLASTMPAAEWQTPGELVVAAVTELMLGGLLALGFQLAFGALAFAGRVLDVQAGFGLALVIDPGSRSQAPMFGTILSLVAGLIFFAGNGHLEAMRLLGSLTHVFPPGKASIVGSPSALMHYLSLVLGLGLGAVSAVMLTLFLIDLTIAYLSRALPQMNALMLGLQVKTIATLIVLTLSAGLLGPVVLHLMRASLDFVPSLDAP